MIPVGAVLFFLFYKAISAKLFAPFVGLFEAREQETVGAESRAAESSKEANDLTLQYEAEVRDARARAMEERDKILSQAKKEASQSLNQARDSAEELIRNARWEMAGSLDDLRKSAAKEADQLVEAIVEKAKSPRGVSDSSAAAGRSN